MSIYDFTVKGKQGDDISLADYKGKVLLVVNTATKCGFTPQYDGLQKLYDTYKEEGFEILDFPCNQFKEQAPGTADEIDRRRTNDSERFAPSVVGVLLHYFFDDEAPVF